MTISETTVVCSIIFFSEAFGLDFNSNDDEKQYSYRPHTLESLFAAGVSSLKVPGVIFMHKNKTKQNDNIYFTEMK